MSAEPVLICCETCEEGECTEEQMICDACAKRFAKDARDAAIKSHVKVQEAEDAITAFLTPDFSILNRYDVTAIIFDRLFTDMGRKLIADLAQARLNASLEYSRRFRHEA